MGRKRSSRKRGKGSKNTGKQASKEDTVQKPFRLMDLPPELRIMIYRLVVIPESKSRWACQVCPLVPPVLAQVSKQIRKELLPIYYGENTFSINIDMQEENDEGNYNKYILEDKNIKVEEFFRMCSCMADTGGLRYIKKLKLSYSKPAWIGPPGNYMFVFYLIGTGGGEVSRDRVGNDNLDWSDRQQVTKAVMAALMKSKSVGTDPQDIIWAIVPISHLVQVLCTLAMHCHYANQYVEFWWDWGW